MDRGRLHGVHGGHGQEVHGAVAAGDQQLQLEGRGGMEPGLPVRQPVGTVDRVVFDRRDVPNVGDGAEALFHLRPVAVLDVYRAGRFDGATLVLALMVTSSH